MAKLLKDMRGYVRIRVNGFAAERFINLCGNRGICLWEIIKCGDDYCMNLYLKSFWTIRPIARKTGAKVVVLERYGLPFFLPKMWKRKGYLLGGLLTLSFWIGSSFFIWDIEVYGNYRITGDMFEDFLESNQVYVGMQTGKLDIQTLEKEIRREFNFVTWASAKLNGTKLEIYIKENDAPLLVETDKETVGTDLVADCDGKIISMIVRNGVPKVKIGDTVEEGMIMVEGKIPVYNEDTTVREYIYVDADADIVVERTRNYSSRLSYDYVVKSYTGREDKDYYFRWESDALEVFDNCPFLIYDSMISESRPELLKILKIPLYFGNVTHREYVNVEREYTLEQAEQLLNEKIIIFLSSLEEKGVQIIEKNVKIDTNSNSWVVEAEVLVHEAVGTPRETVESETGENIADE